ncbi:MAG: hypothetical protein HY775_04385 [Acidobacteria bacterium]|nr:hypothetical protein [Acidobacteriota bacterium]
MRVVERPSEVRAAPPAPERRTHVLRFTLWSRITHAVLGVSVFGLVLTGMPLKYSDAFWAWPLVRMWGGPHLAGRFHRGFALGLFASVVMHLGGLGVAAVRRRLPPLFGPDSILPRVEDARHIARNLRYLRGKGPPPKFGKFTYWEKFDYFGVFWGLLIIGLSGLVMWFPMIAARFFPGWVVTASLIFHSDEALLATGFLFAIHFFNTHLRPEVFPLDPSIFTGRVDLASVAHERPGWYERLVASGRAARPERPVPAVVRAGGIAFLVLGTIILMLVMLTAVAEVAGYILQLVSP